MQCCVLCCLLPTNTYIDRVTVVFTLAGGTLPYKSNDVNWVVNGNLISRSFNNQPGLYNLGNVNDNNDCPITNPPLQFRVYPGTNLTRVRGYTLPRN